MNTNYKDDYYVKNKRLNDLFKYIKNNELDQFMNYLSNMGPEDVDINGRDEAGNYLIFFAVIMNNREILWKLLDFGCKIDVFDSEGYNILYYPIKYNYPDILDVLLKYNIQKPGISLLNLKDKHNNVAIFYSIKYNNLYALKELLDKGADVNYKNSNNMNSLHLAVLKKNLEMIKMIIKQIKNINSRTKDGSTVLHYSCNLQLENITELLLDHGANPNIADLEFEFYPIFYSVLQNDVKMTKILLNRGINPNLQDYLGNTVLHYAIISDHTEILDNILNKFKIKWNTEIYKENINDPEFTNCIDPNINNIDGLTVTHLLLYNYKENHDKYLSKILPHCNLNNQDNNGNTILHLIIEKDLWTKFDKLLKLKKLNIFIKNNDGVSVNKLMESKRVFMETVVQSYYNYLRKHGDIWPLKWQNKCSNSDLNDVEIEKCHNLILNHIEKNKISFPLRKNKKNIKIMEDNIVNFSTFTGSSLDMIIGFKFLTKKYMDATSLFHTEQELSNDLANYNRSFGIVKNKHQHLIQFEIMWIHQQIFFPPLFEELLTQIIKDSQKKYIIMSIGIILSNGNHSNGLLLDVINKKVERFEPHGSNYPSQFNYNPELLDKILYLKMKNSLSNIYKTETEINYIKPSEYLPKIGFQTLENTEVHINKNIGDPNGFCTLWTIWYFDYRLKYIYMNPSNFAKKLLKEIKINNYSFRSIIRNYSKKITDLRDIYLSTIGKNVNDYINDKLSENEIKKLLKLIVSNV